MVISGSPVLLFPQAATALPLYQFRVTRSEAVIVRLDFG
jgi:hypothetical protein